MLDKFDGCDFRHVAVQDGGREDDEGGVLPAPPEEQLSGDVDVRVRGLGQSLETLGLVQAYLHVGRVFLKGSYELRELVRSHLSSKPFGQCNQQNSAFGPTICLRSRIAMHEQNNTTVATAMTIQKVTQSF